MSRNRVTGSIQDTQPAGETRHPSHPGCSAHGPTGGLAAQPPRLKQAYPRQNEVICRKVGLFAAESAYPPKNKLFWRDSRLSPAKQPYPGQKKVIHGKTGLSAPISPYPRRHKLIWDKVGLPAAKWACLPKIR